MKRQGWCFLAVAAAAAGAGCFDDPTSSLREGPARLVLTRSSVVLATGDSIAVTATLVDAQGNVLPITGAEWSTADASVATVGSPLEGPESAFHRIQIKGVSEVGGVTTVTAQSRGQSASVRVAVVPDDAPPGSWAVSGTSQTDTVGIAPNTSVISAGDTLVLTLSGLLEFDTTAAGGRSAVLFGAGATAPSGYILSRTPTQIKALARGPHSGSVRVTNVNFLGTAETGVIALAELETESLAIAQPRFRGTATLSGGGILMTVTAPAELTFNAATSNVVFTDAAGAATVGTVISRSTTEIVVSSSADCTGCTLKVTNVSLGSTVLDSLKSTAAVSISRATFPGTVTTNGNLLDVVTITPTGGATLDATTSTATIGGMGTFIVSRTATELQVVPMAGSSGPISISNVTVGGVLFPTLDTPADVIISSTVTGEANEPGNDLMSTSPVLAATNSYQTLYGAVQAGSDVDDFFRFDLAAPGVIDVILTWFGTGSGGAGNPDVDAFVVRDLDGNDNPFNADDFCDEFGGNFVEADCTGATAGHPEFEITQTLPAGTYFLYVNLFGSGGVTAPIVYELQYRVTP
jgi:hypothetical protein